jgi:hypothetical protein
MSLRSSGLLRLLGGKIVPDKILVEIIDEHLPYEIDMLRLTYRELEATVVRGPNESRHQNACRFALIESFCVHARSLIDFFADSSTNPNDAIASNFTTGFVSGLDQTVDEVVPVCETGG